MARLWKSSFSDALPWRSETRRSQRLISSLSWSACRFAVCRRRAREPPSCDTRCAPVWGCPRWRAVGRNSHRWCHCCSDPAEPPPASAGCSSSFRSYQQHVTLGPRMEMFLCWVCVCVCFSARKNSCKWSNSKTQWTQTLIGWDGQGVPTWIIITMATSVPTPVLCKDGYVSVCLGVISKVPAA